MKKSLVKNLSWVGASLVLMLVAFVLITRPNTKEVFKSMFGFALEGAGSGAGAGGTTTLTTDSDGKWSKTGTWDGGDKPGSTVDADEIVYVEHDCNLDEDIEVKGQLIITSTGSLSGSKKLKIKDNGSVTAAGEIDVKEIEVEDDASFTSTANVSCDEDFKADGDVTINLSGFVYVKKKLEIKDGANCTFSDSIYVKEELKIEESTASFNGLYAKKKIEVKDNSTVSFTGYTYAKEGVDKFEDSEITISGHFTSKKDLKIEKSTVSVTGYLTCEKNLEIDNASSVLNIDGSLYVKKNLDNSGTINVETSTEKTGSVFVKGNTTGNTELTFNRLIKKDGWHYVSSPITDAQTDVLMGGAVYSYDEATGAWTQHGTGESLNPGTGYDVYFKNQHKTLTFTGDPNSGSFSYALTRTSSSSNSGYNLVGNPYPCAIDWEASSGWTKTNVGSTIYVWDDSLQNITTYTTGGASTNGGSAVIPPTMAFFVKVTSVGAGTLAFTENVKVEDVQNFRSRKVKISDALKLKIKGQGFGDETIVRFNDRALDEFDEWDAEKLYSYNAQVPQIYSKLDDGTPLAVNSLTKLDRTVSIPMYIYAKVAGEYEIDFDLLNFELPMNIFLEDLTTGEMIDLNAESYKFETNQVQDEQRFIIHFIPFNTIETESYDSNTTSGIEKFDSENFNIYSSGSMVYIKSNKKITDGKVYIFDLNGENIMQGKFDNGKSRSYKLDVPEGYYIVTLISDGKANSKKVLIR